MTFTDKGSRKPKVCGNFSKDKCKMESTFWFKNLYDAPMFRKTYPRKNIFPTITESESDGPLTQIELFDNVYCFLFDNTFLAPPKKRSFSPTQKLCSLIRKLFENRICLKTEFFQWSFVFVTEKPVLRVRMCAIF